jgi:hypothetical protein
MKAQGAGPAGAPATESVEDLERASKNGTGGQRRAVEGGGEQDPAWMELRMWRAEQVARIQIL